LRHGGKLPNYNGTVAGPDVKSAALTYTTILR